MFTSRSIVLVLLRPFVPGAFRKLKHKLMLSRSVRHGRDACAGMSVEQTFETVYKRNLWGGADGEFYSGQGSDPEVTASYCRFVRRFIQERNIKSVVDLGCGDFRVGQNLVVPGTVYTGIDIVPDLIERNTREFAAPNVSFRVINAIHETPPPADLCLIRQVLQHLSNEQILAVLRNCSGFRYLLVSEHLTLSEASDVNIDKPHGPDTRASGTRMDLPPFSRQTETVLEVGLAAIGLGDREVIRTVLIEQKR
jgi:hypothetical protein